MSKEKEYINTAVVVIEEALRTLQCVRVELHPDGGVVVCQKFDRLDTNYPSIDAWLEDALEKSAKTSQMFQLEARCRQMGFDKACVTTNSNELFVSLGGLKATILLNGGWPFAIKKIDLLDRNNPKPVIQVKELESLLTSLVTGGPRMDHYTSEALFVIAKNALKDEDSEDEPQSST